MLARWVRFVLALIILVQFSFPAPAAETDEYTVFISGFTAFQNQDYKTAAEKMSLFLKEYPGNPMGDMALFWLARAHFRLGNRQDAARCMARFLRENPDTPLKSAVEDDLLTLARSFEKGVPSDAPKSGRRESVAERAAPSIPDDRGRESRRAEKPMSSPREKAVAEYREIMERYPGTRAAVAAEERLKGLGEAGAVGKAPDGRKSMTDGVGGGRQVLTLEVGQSAAAEFNLTPHAPGGEVGRRISIPFEVINRGNGADSFLLESGFGPEFNPAFASAAKPDVTITATPQLASGERFKGVLLLTIPPADIDGRKNTAAVRVASRFDHDVTLSKDVSILSMAPFVRMVMKPEKERVRPGETVSYRIAILNVGSAPARCVSFTISYPPQYEPVESAPVGFRRESKSVMVSDEVSIGSGERKEYILAFRVKGDALAGQELFCRAEMMNRELKTSETFLSAPAVVERVSGVTARAAMERITLLPGQKAVLPLTVTNAGNVRESIVLKPAVPSGIRYAFYRSGGEVSRQTDETVSDSIGPLSPGEEVSLKLEITAPADGADGSESTVTVAFEPEGDRKNPAAIAIRLNISRPVVEIHMVGRGERLKPGELSHVLLHVVNRGSATARDLEIRGILPDGLEVVAADPSFVVGPKGERLWRLADLGPGEKRTIDLAFRVRPDVAAGTSLRIENLVGYKDQQGNSY